ncbi:unnamed protein product, partial [Scytosiphon promiscuus]
CPYPLIRLYDFGFGAIGCRKRMLGGRLASNVSALGVAHLSVRTIPLCPADLAPPLLTIYLLNNKTSSVRSAPRAKATATLFPWKTTSKQRPRGEGQVKKKERSTTSFPHLSACRTCPAPH